MTAEHPAYETLRAVHPQASVLLQRNPGPMTLDGTNTWLLRSPSASQTVIVDPGEASEEHLASVLAHARDVALVLITHGHTDHTGLIDGIHGSTGAAVRAVHPAHCRVGEPLVDNEVIDAAGVRLRVLATPGHTADSACFVLVDPRTNTDAAVLTGDTILGRGTAVVAYPDGALGPYLESLQRLRELGDVPAWCGHGPELPSAADIAARYLSHRAARLEQVRAALRTLGGDTDAQQIVEHVYADVDQNVWWAAELSVRAQLDYLRNE